MQGDSDTDPDPVDGQVYSLTLDHGFFTSGQGPRPAVVGDLAGDLVDLGQTLTGLTDAHGEMSFQVGIARDPGFDDDGQVTATVTAEAGSLAETKTVGWDSGAPLNGRVEVALSTEAEQDGPVDPALAGERVYHEVFTLDQFGNRVGGKPVDLTYSGDLDDWDYSDDFVDSDFDTSGDIWVDSFEAGTIKVTGTWKNAPTYRYVDTAGAAVAATADATGSHDAEFYEIDFDAARFTIRSSVTDTVVVGSTATQTVRVVDQMGNPVRGFGVQFFRYGPDRIRGDALATRETNRRGEASYTFVGNTVGRAKVTAEVTDGVRSRMLTQYVDFGSAVAARLAALKRNSGADRMQVSAGAAAAGAKVQLYRVISGRLYLAGTGALSRLGTATFKVRDRNGRARTRYVAWVRSTPRTVADQSNTANIR